MIQLNLLLSFQVIQSKTFLNKNKFSTFRMFHTKFFKPRN